MKTHRGLIGVGLSLLAGLALPSETATARDAAAQAPKHASSTLETALLRAAPTLRPEALRAALSAWNTLHARGKITSPLLTVIDYGLASTVKRLWVFDLDSRRLLFHELVAHGRNSGGDMATSFSNEDGSLMTSLGAFLTGTTYSGKNGYSLRLQGMDPGLNDRAESRSIVLHGAPYVSEQFARKVGRLGRSHGCPAVPADVARTLIDRIKGHTLLYAWHPSLIPAATPTQVASPDTQSVR